MTHDIRITYGPHTTRLQEAETALDALLRAGSPIGFSCKSGVCGTCLVRCTSGSVPERAQRGLPPHLVERRYLLACQCRPDTSMVLTPRQPADMLTNCALMSISGHGSTALRIELELATTLAYATGDRVRLVDGGPPEDEPELELVSRPDRDYLVVALLHLPPGGVVPTPLAADFEFGGEIVLRGPFSATRPTTSALRPAEERGPPPTDPALWAELGDGVRVRQVLEAFYAKVYRDPQLAPFFESVTIERSIEKQYSFLKQSFTGAKVYFGNRPRNAHHWMVISDAIFDHRQQLMMDALRQAALTEDQITRWTSFEEHYRSEMVKAAAWPRQVGNTWLDTETFEIATLGEATVCDYCGDEVAAGTEARFHRRLARIGCAGCQTGAAQQST